MLNLVVVILTCSVNLLLGSFVLLQNSRLRRNIAFFLVSLFISLWDTSNFLAGKQSVHLLYNNIFNRGAFLFAFLAVISGLWFSSVFPVVIIISKKKLRVVLAVVIVGAVISATPWVGGQVTADGHGLEFSLGSLLIVYALVVLISLVLIIRNLMSATLRLRGRAQQQAIFILVGFSLPIVLALTTNVILPLTTASWQAAALGPSFTILFVAITTYAIVKHSLFDIRFFAVRAAAYFTTLFVMTFVLVLPTILLFGHFLDYHPNRGQLLLLAFVCVSVLYVLQYIRARFDYYTTKIFFRHYHDPQDVLDKLSEVLVRTSDISYLRTRTGTVLEEALQPSQLKYVLFAEKPELQTKLSQGVIAFNKDVAPNVADLQETTEEIKYTQIFGVNNVALAVKLSTKDADLGYLIVGRKRSGALYGDRDKRLLSVAAEEIAISLQNVLRFQEIQLFNATLQHSVNEATIKLRVSNKQLKQLDETKDDFISMASHQLRTPLTSVKGYLSMVLEGDAGPLNENQKKLLEQSFRSSQQMVYLISDLLNLSRLNTGKFIIDQSPVDLSDLVQFEVNQLDETAKSRSVTLIYEKPTAFPPLMLDETKTHQVVMNFIDNAIYYTPKGGTVTIQLNQTPTFVEFTVSDTGIGVPKEVQHKLFSKFYRAENAQKARPDGTGLGLFMAKKVIIAQGGSILFKSEEGKGSMFGFRFNKARHLTPGETEKVTAMSKH
jgi:signal transduction histidine kinase